MRPEEFRLEILSDVEVFVPLKGGILEHSGSVKSDMENPSTGYSIIFEEVV